MSEKTSSVKAITGSVLVFIVRVYLLLAMPILLVIGSARLVMLPQVLDFEYQRSGFPKDSYGFSTEDRLRYGPLGIDYLLNDADISFLGDLTLPGALCFPTAETPCKMFNDSELAHMEDVKIVTQTIFRAGLLGAILAVCGAIGLWWWVDPQHVRYALMQSSILTLGIIAWVIILAVIAWDTFFESFHALFFEEGTWQFFFSDTLIRLYPQQFWFDAALFVGSLTVSAAIVILIVVTPQTTIRRLFPSVRRAS